MSDKKGVETLGKETARKAIIAQEENIERFKGKQKTDLENFKREQQQKLNEEYQKLSTLRGEHRSFRSWYDPRRWLGFGGKSRRNSRRGKKSNRTRKSNRK